MSGVVANQGTSVQPTSDQDPLLFILLKDGDIVANDGTYGKKNCSKLYAISKDAPSNSSDIARPTNDVGESNAIRKIGGNAEVYRIQVIESLGSGGFGSVYKCIKRQKGAQGKQDICLKFCHKWDFGEEADPEINKHIIREVETFQKFENDSHENIIQFYFACFCPRTDRVFIGLEYFSGFDLSKFIKFYLKAKRRFPANHINDILHGVINAVMHVQKKWLVHCDIKPHNVMFNCFNQRVKLIDFGCAVDTDSDEKTFGGTSEYMAPEMLTQDHVAESVKLDSTDVYGIGALLYHLLTLERPWLDHLDVREAFKKNKRHSVKRAIYRAMKKREPVCGPDGKMCSYTPLQTKMIDFRQQHYQVYPDHCDLACSMLEFDKDDRLSCEQVLTKLLQTCMCEESRRNRRKQVKWKAEQSPEQDPNQQMVDDWIANPNIPLMLEQFHFASSSNRVTSAPNTLTNHHKKLLLDRLSAQTASSTKTSASHSGKVQQDMEFESHSSEVPIGHERAESNQRKKEEEQPPISNINQATSDNHITETPTKTSQPEQTIDQTLIREIGGARPRILHNPSSHGDHRDPDVRPRNRVSFARQKSTPIPKVEHVGSRENKFNHAHSSRLEFQLNRRAQPFESYSVNDLSPPYTPENLPDEESPLWDPESPQLEDGYVCNEMEQKLKDFIENLPYEEYGNENGISDRSVRFIPAGETNTMGTSAASVNSSIHSFMPTPIHSNVNLERLCFQNSARNSPYPMSTTHYTTDPAPFLVSEDDYDELD